MSNRAIAEGYFSSVSKNDIEGALGVFTKEAQFVAPMGPVPFPDGVRAFLGGYATSFPGHGFEITNVVEAGDQVAVEGVWLGKHTGPMTLPTGKTIPPTGKTVRAPFVTLFTVRDGRIVSHRGYWDMAGFLAQLGLTPG
jgi:steroid delta-isomerase-like uncharacterized protein